MAVQRNHPDDMCVHYSRTGAQIEGTVCLCNRVSTKPYGVHMKPLPGANRSQASSPLPQANTSQNKQGTAQT
jgi:hypothetical protein